MAADFDAGSIEGTLDLDTRPFVAGLRRAKAQAEKFEKEKHEARVGLDDGEFRAKQARLKAEMEGMTRKVVTPKIDARGVNRMSVALTVLRNRLRSVGRGLVVTGGISAKIAAAGFSLATNKIVLLTAAAVTLGAALGPLSGALAAFAGAAVTAIGPLVAGFGLFTGGLVKAIGLLKEANAEGKKLAGWGGKAQTAFLNLKDTWEAMEEGNRPRMFKLIAVALEIANTALYQMSPLLRTVTIGLTKVAYSIGKVFNSQRFTSFIGTVDKFLKSFLDGAVRVIPNVMLAFMNAFQLMQPILKIFGDGIVRASQGLREWTQAGGGLQRFVERIVPWLPKIGDLIGHVFQTLGKIATGLAPLAGPALEFIDALVVGLGNIDWSGLANGLVPIVRTLTKSLPTIVDALNLVIGLFDRLANLDGVGQLALHVGLLAGALFKISKMKIPAAVLALLGVGGKAKGAAGAAGGIAETAALGAGAAAATGKLGKLARMLGRGLKFAGKRSPWGLAAFTIYDIATASDKADKKVGKYIKTLAPGAKEAEAIAKAHTTWADALRVTNGQIDRNARGLAYDRLNTNLLKNANLELAMSDRQLVTAVTQSGRQREILGRRLLSNTTLTDGQKRAILREISAIDAARVKNAELAVAEAKRGVATAQGTAQTDAANRKLREAQTELRKAREEAHKGAKFNLNTQDALNKAANLRRQIANMMANAIPISVVPVVGGVGAAVAAAQAVSKGVTQDAKGGVTTGPRFGWTGDNPGGQEAIIPLNEYDVPRKGDIAAIAAGSAAASQKVVSALAFIAAAIKSANDPEALADALDKVMGKHSDAQVRRLTQLQRSA